MWTSGPCERRAAGGRKAETHWFVRRPQRRAVRGPWEGGCGEGKPWERAGEVHLRPDGQAAGDGEDAADGLDDERSEREQIWNVRAVQIDHHGRDATWDWIRNDVQRRDEACWAGGRGGGSRKGEGRTAGGGGGDELDEEAGEERERDARAADYGDDPDGAVLAEPGELGELEGEELGGGPLEEEGDCPDEDADGDAEEVLEGGHAGVAVQAAPGEARRGGAAQILQS